MYDPFPEISICICIEMLKDWMIQWNLSCRKQLGDVGWQTLKMKDVQPYTLGYHGRLSDNSSPQSVHMKRR